MPRITSKGQVTIPLEIRDRFSLLPGTDVEVITDKNQVLIVKARKGNAFLKWLGRGKANKDDIDITLKQLRGRADE